MVGTVIGLIVAGTVLLAAVGDQPLWLAIGGLVGTLVAALVSIRLVRPRARQIVAQAGDFDSQRWDRLMQRYEKVVEAQDEQLRTCHDRIDELDRAERECEERNDELQRRVHRLEELLRAHGLTT